MFGHQIERVYFRIRALGLVKSKRHYAEVWLGRAQTMLRDMVAMGRRDRLVRRDAVDRLRDRLVALATIVPPGVAREVLEVVDEIDRDVAVTQMLLVGR